MQEPELVTTSKADTVGPRTIELYRNGFHCAEAVLVAVLEAASFPPGPPVPRVATCFGGGVGRSHEEICGALAGGLMAVGCVLGRDRQGESWDASAQAAAALREQFLERQGSTCCGEILAKLGPQQGHQRCHALSADTAELTCQVLKKFA